MPLTAYSGAVFRKVLRFVLLAAAVLTPLTSAAQAIEQRAEPPTAQTSDVNKVTSIRTVGSSVEIELYSSRRFPVRDEVVVLRIGAKEFVKSRYLADGSLHTLIFSLAASEFSELPDRTAMSVGFGRENPKVPGQASGRPDPTPRWYFGQLDKSRLDR